MKIYVKKFFDFHILYFPGFNRDFIIYTDFTRIAVSNTATHNVIN